MCAIRGRNMRNDQIVKLTFENKNINDGVELKYLVEKLNSFYKLLNVVSNEQENIERADKRYLTTVSKGSIVLTNSYERFRSAYCRCNKAWFK
jgi:hypothetical protein